MIDEVQPRAVRSHTHETMPYARGDVIGHLFRDHGLRSNVLGHKRTAELREIHAEEHGSAGRLV